MTLHTGKHKGYTLIEMLLVVAIVALLATIGIPVFAKLKQKAGYAGCVSRMRIMHTSFTTYMQDHDMVWPQVPKGLSVEKEEWKFWHQALKDYGMSKNQWVCPSDAIPTDEEDREWEFYSSYLPTQFDEFPNTAFRWKQPWVIERGEFHSEDKGPNMLMPDGTIAQGPRMSP